MLQGLGSITRSLPFGTSNPLATQQRKVRFGTGDKPPVSSSHLTVKTLGEAAKRLAGLTDDTLELTKTAPARPGTSNQGDLNAARSQLEASEARLSATVEHIKNLRVEVERLQNQRERSHALRETATEGASSSAAPAPGTADRMTLAERTGTIEQLGHVCKQLLNRSAEEERLQKFRDVIAELKRTHPMSLDGNPAAKEALMKAVGDLLDPQPAPRRRGRRSAQPASNDMAQGLTAAVKRGHIEHVVEQLSKFVAQAKRHSGNDLGNAIIDWTARGLLRTISIVLPNGMRALDALERTFLVRLTGATHHASTTRAHLELLRQAAGRAQGADRQALLEAHALLKSPHGWNAHGELLKQLFRGIAQVLRPDDIAKHDRETAPRLVAHYRREIAGLKQQSSERAIPQTDTVSTGQRDADAARLQREGRKLDIEDDLQTASESLAAAEGALPGLQAEVKQARTVVSLLKQQHAKDQDNAHAAAAADEARARAERLKHLTHQSDQVWGDILESRDILNLFDDPKTLAQVVKRHVGLTPKEMTDRLKQGQTAHVGSFRSREAFLNALVQLAQTIHGDKEFEFTPGQPKILQLTFPASSGWVRLRDGKDKEVPKSMSVSVTLNAEKKITHLHPNVESEDRREAARTRGFNAVG